MKLGELMIAVVVAMQCSALAAGLCEFAAEIEGRLITGDDFLRSKVESK